jgi:autotransporter translocation and assembly factor TamB
MGARLRGRFAISFADTFAIHDTDVRFSNVSTKLIEQLVPGFNSPRRGTLDGQLAILGGRNAMQLNGDVAFHDPGTGTSRVIGGGAVGLANGEFRMRNLKVRAAPMQVALVKALLPSLAQTIPQIGGTLVGTVNLNGSTRTALAVAGAIEHRDRGGVSNLAGSAGIKLGRVPSFTIDLRARPLSLAEVGLFAPSLGLRGTASGPIKLRGTLADMRISTALQLSSGGWVRADGRLALAGSRTSYDLTGELQGVNLNSMIAKAPETSLTGKLSARGTGFTPATMRAAIAADFTGFRWKGVSAERLTGRVAVANGLATVERLFASAAGTRIEAAGTFGLRSGRSGELHYSVAIDSLGTYDKWIPGTRTGVERPRTALVARAFEKARADSIRIARATEVERAATGRAMPRIPLDTPSSLARSVTTGRLRAAGTLRGNINDFDIRGRLAADNVILRGNSARSLQAEYAWTNARTSNSTIAVGVEGGQLSVKGFAFDTLSGRLSYRKPDGELQIAVRQGEDRDYSARASFVLGPRRTVRVNDLALRADTTTWRLAHVAEVHWHAAGIEVHDVLLQSNTGGRVYANGLLPTQGQANLVLDVSNFQIADISSFLQSDLALRGVLTARGVLEGSLRDPQFRGAAGLVNGNYNGSAIPDFQSTFTYANASLTAHAEALRKNGMPALVADAVMPINLALSGVTGPRLLDAPLRVDVSGDSLPLDLIPGFTDAVADIQGVAVGRFAMRGTLKRPTFAGGVTWTKGSVRVVSTGMFVHDIAASLRMARDTVYVDSASGVSGRGTVRLAGHLLVGSWREPGFDLHLVADNAEVLNNDHGRLSADVGLSLTGPFKSAYVAGLVHVRQGVGYIPEPTHKNLVNAGDPAVFAVMDTSVMSDRELFPTSNALLENMRIDVDVTINRNTWLRSRDANIEMFTEEPIRVHREADALALTGVISTDRGEYTFLSKRFEVKRGSATFTGGAELNPIVQATGEYEVALAGRPNFNVRVLIGGTLQKPKLTLESDAQPPISQSDLLSYLAFGRSASSLLQLEGSGLTGASATGNLVGVGAALATKRMAAVALGVMADEVEGEATRGLGADVFNITPADVPTELGGQGVVNFFQSTKVEAGKYLSPYFFMALQAQQYPGIRAEYRTPKGWRYEGTIEPRYLLQPPSLDLQPIRPVTAFGAFIIREWRF